MTIVPAPSPSTCRRVRRPDRRACRATPAAAAATRRRRSPPACRATSRDRSAAPAIAARRPRPISTTSVTPFGCELRRSPTRTPRSSWPRDDEERRRDAAVRDRNAGQRRRRDGARHARHDVERNAGALQRQRFFAAAAEHERIAALQPHDAACRAARRGSSARGSPAASSRGGRRACRRRTAARGARSARTRSSTSAS